MESTRVDKWLWAVRLFKTRSAAADACKAGHVRVNDSKAKPATTVRAGDTVEARVHRRQRVVDVVEVIDKRVGAPIAQECYVDRSPPPPPRDPLLRPVETRPPGSGRPTKKERREMDRLKGRRR